MSQARHDSGSHTLQPTERGMRVRRAEYCQGNGRLWVNGGRLLFVTSAEHPVVEDLERAARGERPSRSVAATVIAADFDVPPFVFAEEGETLQGIVCGDLQITVDAIGDDEKSSVVDGTQGDPWSYLNSDQNAAVSLDDGTIDGSLWVESGAVLAGGFRWSRIRADLAGHVHSFPLAPPAASERFRAAPPDTPAGSGPARSGVPHTATAGTRDQSQERESVSPHRGSLAEALETELDTTVEAIRLAELRDEPAKGKPARRPRRSSPAPSAPSGTLDAASAQPFQPAEQKTPSNRPATVEGGSPPNDAGPEPEQAPLEVPQQQRRMVRSLVCLECGSPNPPSASHCRGCDALLATASTDVRDVPQPVLGVIQLSDGREEILNADLLIGRNPTYERLRPHQRAVVHGQHDRSVSRRHVELRLDGWRVLATILAEASGTTIESLDGAAADLNPGSPRELLPGDTVRFGDAWLHFFTEG